MSVKSDIGGNLRRILFLRGDRALFRLDSRYLVVRTDSEPDQLDVISRPVLAVVPALFEPMIGAAGVERADPPCCCIYSMPTAGLRGLRVHPIAC